MLQGDVPGDFEVNLPIFAGRAHIDEVDLPALLAVFGKLLRFDDGAHDLLLGSSSGLGKALANI